MKKMTIVIAGTSMTIQMDEALAFLLTPLQDFFCGFLKQQGGSTTIQVTLSYNHFDTVRKFADLPRLLPHRKDGKTVKILSRVEELYPFSEETVLIGFLNGVLAYNVRSQRGHLHLFRSTGKNFLMGSLYKLLFLFMAIAMAEQNKFMIHGAGIVRKSEGFLCLGASGAGKSTVAGYVSREDVLSDDAPVISKERGGFTIHASPFSQVNLFEKKAVNHHQNEAPLTKLMFLKQANHVDLKFRDKRSALAELLQKHLHGFDLMDRELKVSVFHFCYELCSSVPVFDLYFQKDGQFLLLF